MDIEAMRDLISKAYGPDASRWILRCKRMNTSQVVAVYLRMKERGMFDRRRKRVKELQRKSDEYQQMTLWDYGVDL